MVGLSFLNACRRFRLINSLLTSTDSRGKRKDCESEIHDPPKFQKDDTNSPDTFTDPQRSSQTGEQDSLVAYKDRF